MKISGHWLGRPVSVGVILCLTAPWGEAAIVRQQQTKTPSAIQAKSSSDGATSTAAQLDSNAQSGTLPQDQQQKNGSSSPVGTAAAPYQKAEGVPASRPAGAVVAPAKQKRTRSFLIKVGVIVGAAVAIGTVAALSKGSPSRP